MQPNFNYFKEKLVKNPKHPLTDKQKKLFLRLDKYESHQQEYLKNKTKIFDNEL